MLQKYNDMLKQEYGDTITVELVSYVEDDDSVLYTYTSQNYGNDHPAFETIEEAYNDVCMYLAHNC